MRSLLIVPVLLSLTAIPAGAAGSIACNVDDRSIKLNLEAAFSHGVGDQLVNGGGTLEINAKDGVYERLRNVALTRESFTQFWLEGRELKFKIYHAGDGEPFGELTLVIETRQPKGADPDESSYEGTYRLSSYHFDSKTGPEGKTTKLEGKVSCSAGF